MNNSVSIPKTTILHSHAKNLLGDLKAYDRREIILKTMAVIELHQGERFNFSIPNNGIDRIILDAEAQYPEIFVQSGRQVLSERLNDLFMQKLIDEFSHYTVKGLWTTAHKKAIILDVLSDWGKYPLTGNVILKSSVYELCRALFEKTDGDVYLPFDEELFNGVELVDETTQVFIETPVMNELLPIIRFILKGVHHQTANPITSPAYVRDGKLQTFAKGLVVNPWGVKIDTKTLNVGHFAVGGNTYQNYLVQHLFAQVSDLALVFVPQNALTASIGSEVEFREWLINQKHLKAVVSLPSGLIVNTGMACSLMVFDLKNQYDSVRLISLKDSSFVQKNQLVNAKTLANIIQGDAFDQAVTVSHQDIASQNFVLDPERYVLDEDSKKAVARLANYRTAKLGDIADIIRPVAIGRLKEEGDEEIGEIQSGDLPAYGYINAVSKQSFISQKALVATRSSSVQTGDIIMTIRGSTGKVGLVGQDLLDGASCPVVVGQTSIIIRPHTDKINPTALYMQLHAQFAQSRLALLSVGASIAGLSVKDIKEFDIALLNDNDTKTLIDNFNKQCQITDEILAKQRELAKLSNDFWA